MERIIYLNVFSGFFLQTGSDLAVHTEKLSGISSIESFDPKHLVYKMRRR